MRSLYTMFGVFGSNPPQLYSLTFRWKYASVFVFGLFRLISTFLCSLTQTNLIVVDLSDVSNDLEHMLKTNRYPCILKEEKYINCLRKAKPDSVLGRIWSKAQEKPCELFHDSRGFEEVSKMMTGCTIGDITYM